MFRKPQSSWLRFRYDLVGFSRLLNWKPNEWQLEQLQKIQEAARQPDGRAGVVVPPGEDAWSVLAALAFWRARVWDQSSTLILSESSAERVSVMAHLVQMISKAQHGLAQGFQLAKNQTCICLDGEEQWSIAACEPGLIETQEAPTLRDDPLTVIVPSLSSFPTQRIEATAPLANLWVMLLRP